MNFAKVCTLRYITFHARGAKVLVLSMDKCVNFTSVILFCPPNYFRKSYRKWSVHYTEQIYIKFPIDGTKSDGKFQIFNFYVRIVSVGNIRDSSRQKKKLPIKCPSKYKHLLSVNLWKCRYCGITISESSIYETWKFLSKEFRWKLARARVDLQCPTLYGTSLYDIGK